MAKPVPVSWSRNSVGDYCLTEYYPKKWWHRTPRPERMWVIPEPVMLEAGRRTIEETTIASDNLSQQLKDIAAAGGFEAPIEP